MLFLLPIELQQVAHYSPTARRRIVAAHHVAACFALSSRSGALSARIGPRLQMTVGPLIVAAGLALFARDRFRRATTSSRCCPPCSCSVSGSRSRWRRSRPRRCRRRRANAAALRLRSTTPSRARAASSPSRSFLQWPASPATATCIRRCSRTASSMRRSSPRSCARPAAFSPRRPSGIRAGHMSRGERILRSGFGARCAPTSVGRPTSQLTGLPQRGQVRSRRTRLAESHPA